MANTVEMNHQETAIQGLIAQYLAARPSDPVDGAHIDSDTLSAFVEGSLNEREATPVIGHLVRCSFCRHISADLIRLEFEFADAPVTAAPADAPAGKIAEFINGMFGRIFGTADGAVFAHQDEDEKTDDENAADNADEPDPK
jgi:hypothetical protein